MMSQTARCRSPLASDLYSAAISQSRTGEQLYTINYKLISLHYSQKLFTTPARPLPSTTQALATTGKPA